MQAGSALSGILKQLTFRGSILISHIALQDLVETHSTEDLIPHESCLLHLQLLCICCLLSLHLQQQLLELGNPGSLCLTTFFTLHVGKMLSDYVDFLI